MTELASFRNLSRTRAVLNVALSVYVLIGVLGLWSNWLQVEMLLQVPEGGHVPVDVATANDLRQWQVARATQLVLLLTAVVFLRWTYLTNRNTAALGAAKRQYSPGWSVGWYFIPIANLWKPYLAMKETFRASDPRFVDNWRESATPHLVSVWWLVWTLLNVWNVYANTRSQRVESFEDLLLASLLALATSSLDISLGLIGIMMVNRLHAMQQEKHQLLAATVG